MPAKEEDLAPITDLKMVQRYLRFAIELHETVSCYVEDPGFFFAASTLAFDPDKLTLELELTEENFTRLSPEERAAIDRPRAKIRLSYAVNDVILYVHSHLQARSSKRVAVTVDMPIHKLQRRDALRIKVLDSHKASIRLGTNTFPLYDISAGGLSVLLKAGQEKEYTQQQAFREATLKFLDREFKVNLLVKNVLPATKDGLSFKVGFHFEQLPPAVEQMIAREAYLHTHKIWSRWL